MFVLYEQPSVCPTYAELFFNRKQRKQIYLKITLNIVGRWTWTNEIGCDLVFASQAATSGSRDVIATHQRCEVCRHCKCFVYFDFNCRRGYQCLSHYHCRYYHHRCCPYFCCRCRFHVFRSRFQAWTFTSCSEEDCFGWGWGWGVVWVWIPFMSSLWVNVSKTTCVHSYPCSYPFLCNLHEAHAPSLQSEVKLFVHASLTAKARCMYSRNFISCNSCWNKHAGS